MTEDSTDGRDPSDDPPGAGRVPGTNAPPASAHGSGPSGVLPPSGGHGSERSDAAPLTGLPDADGKVAQPRPPLPPAADDADAKPTRLSHADAKLMRLSDADADAELTRPNRAPLPGVADPDGKVARLHPPRIPHHPTLDRAVQGMIGAQLRSMYEHYVVQPIPDRLLELVQRLGDEAKDKAAGHETERGRSVRDGTAGDAGAPGQEGEER